MKTTRQTIPSRRNVIGTLCTALVFTATATLVHAFPDKPVRIIQAGPPGGALDAVARILADAITPILGQPVVVEAKPGGAGTLAPNELLMAPHDGYTVLLHLDGVVTEVPHSVKAKYDPLKDLLPLADVSSGSLMLAVNPSVPANTVAELVTYLKTLPANSFSYGSYGSGTLGHVSGVILNRAAGIEMNHVPYRGAPPALQDVMGGHIPAAIVGETPMPALVKAGKLKLLASTGVTRSTLFPNVPTFTEAGFPQLQFTPRAVIFAPSDMPAAAQTAWRDAVAAALKQEKTRQRLTDLGVTLPAGPMRSQADIAKSLRADHDKVGALLKSINFKPNE